MTGEEAAWQVDAVMAVKSPFSRLWSYLSNVKYPGTIRAVLERDEHCALAFRFGGVSQRHAMNASPFDTHAAVTALRDAGIDEAPAVAIVNTMRDRE